MRGVAIGLFVGAAMVACSDPGATPAPRPRQLETPGRGWSPEAVADSRRGAAEAARVSTDTAPTPTPALGPSLFDLDLDLEDQSGRKVTTDALRHDGPLIVSMFYASCSYACPTLIRDIAAIDRRLTPAARDRTRVLLVTFDPEHDTPEVLSRLAEAHGVDNDRWVFARARSEEATRELAAALGITYRRLPDGNYNHSSILLVLDAAGVPRAGIDGLKQDPAAFIQRLEALVPER
jgi:protein SCO1/2